MSPTDGDRSNQSDRFDRLPPSPAERTVPDRPTRSDVVAYFADRFGIPPATFEGYSFWEKGNGKVWAFRGEAIDPIAIEAVGMHVLRTRQDHWKPTTTAAQRFGSAASRNAITLPGSTARAFWNGTDQAIEWDGDWGYLIVCMELAGRTVPLGVGLYLHGELRSVVPKSRQERIAPHSQ